MCSRSRWTTTSCCPAANPTRAAVGDVVVCPAIAQAQAPEHGATLDDELALLVVHGVLHLLNYDHADPREEASMQQRERELLARFRAQGPGSGDAAPGPTSGGPPR